MPKGASADGIGSDEPTWRVYDSYGCLGFYLMELLGWDDELYEETYDPPPSKCTICCNTFCGIITFGYCCCCCCCFCYCFGWCCNHCFGMCEPTDEGSNSGKLVLRKITFRNPYYKKSATILIGNLLDIDTKQAMNIFKIKIAPLITYCLQPLAPYLTCSNLEQIEKKKDRFIKRVLGLPKNCSSTFSMHLIGEKAFSEELILNRYTFREEVVKEYAERREEKNLKFVSENYTEGLAFTTDAWKKALQKNRRIVCRTTWHGYHYLLCCTENCFRIDECICKLCGAKFLDRNHILNHESLRTAINDLEELNSSM